MAVNVLSYYWKVNFFAYSILLVTDESAVICMILGLINKIKNKIKNCFVQVSVTLL